MLKICDHFKSEARPEPRHLHWMKGEIFWKKSAQDLWVAAFWHLAVSWDRDLTLPGVHTSGRDIPEGWRDKEIDHEPVAIHLRLHLFLSLVSVYCNKVVALSQLYSDWEYCVGNILRGLQPVRTYKAKNLRETETLDLFLKYDSTLSKTIYFQ